MTKDHSNSHYDIIIAGGGASGLSLAFYIHQELPKKRVLIIEKEDKSSNDRTWCFWTKEKTAFDSIVFKRWGNIRFKNKRQNIPFDIHPYEYQMIRGIDFYQFVRQEIASSKNIKIVKDEVISYDELEGHVEVKTNSSNYSTRLYFNSIPPPIPKFLKTKNNFLLQHFLGYFVKTEIDSFDPSTPNFMDFSVDQCGQTRFGYVLPFSEKEALIEFTIFSEKLLKEEDYKLLLHDYIENNLQISRYEIIEREFGMIPMTDIDFTKKESKRVINIGYRSGMTKGSSGYTFLNIQKDCQLITQSLKREKEIQSLEKAARFRFYDSVLLHVLAKNLVPADQVFSSLFLKNDIKIILRFLDEETNIAEELGILSSLPTLPFLRGAYQSFFSIGKKKINTKPRLKEEVKS